MATPSGTVSAMTPPATPALGVVWLVSELAQHGTGIAAGDIVITRGLTQAVEFLQGDVIDALYDGTPAVTVCTSLLGRI